MISKHLYCHYRIHCFLEIIVDGVVFMFSGGELVNVSHFFCIFAD